MQRLVVDKKGRFKKVFGLPAWVALLLALIVFGLFFGLTRGWLRFSAVNQVLLQNEQWNSDGVLMQGTRFTCVPASLVMLLRDQGIYTTTLDVMEIAGTNTEGTDCSQIPKVADAFGFRVRQERLGFDALMSTDLPAIATFTYEGEFHAVYARPDRRHGWLVVKDPSVGLSTIDKNNMSEYFGVEELDCYLFETIAP